MYDLIVIGDDLSSHVAAAVAAGYGMKTVLVAEHGTGGIYLADDFVFSTDPTPLSGFGPTQTYLTLLAEIDAPPIEREAKLLNPAYQIILPEHRIDFFNDKEALINEIAREFPLQAREINVFYETAMKRSAVFARWLHEHPFIKPLGIKDYYNYLKLVPHLLMQQLERARLLRILAADAALKKVFEAQDALLGNTTGCQSGLASSFQYCTPFRGVYNFQQGKQIIFNSLINKLEDRNGSYLSNCEILDIKRGENIEIEIAVGADNTSVISAKKLIVSTKWDAMHLLLKDKKKINFGDWFNPVKVSHLPFTIHLGCARKCIPEKMSRHVAVVSDIQRDIFDNNLIILEANMTDENAFAAEKISLTATVFLPHDSAGWPKEKLSAESSAMIDRLEFFLPFLKENILFFDLDKSIELSKKSHRVFNPKYQLKRSFITGFAARTNRTRFKNVYLTGASLLLDAGFEGEIISGMNAASRVIAQ